VTLTLRPATRVPKVEGQTLETANAELEALGSAHTVTSGELVIESNPEAGELVTPDTTVMLTLGCARPE
jgi:beta-lactam-binding protein with PASTA domain